MVRLIQISIFLFASWSVSAQTSQNVKGTVLDKDSDFPLTGAEVSIHINDRVYGAVCDIDGEYIIKNVPVGKINVTANFIGYSSQTYENVDLDAGKELVLNFVLVENIAKLEAVEIKVKKKKDQVAFAVVSDYQLDAKQIKLYAGSLNDVSRMAMNYAGVASNNDSQNSIVVRGNNPNSLLWTLEGIDIPNPNHYSASGSSGGPVSMINTNTLGKSDFLAGAFPSNFGNTTAAAFDLQFRTGNKDKYEFLGQLGFAGAELGAEGPINKKNKSSFLVNYRYSTLELFDKIGLNLGIGTAVPKYQDASVLINVPTKKIGRFRIWTLGGQSKIRFLTKAEDNDNLYLDYKNSDLKTYNFTLISGLNHKYFFNKKTSVFSSVSYSYLDQRVTMDTLNTVTHHYDNLYYDKILTGYIAAKTELKYKINAKNLYAAGITSNLVNIDLLMKVNKPTYHYQNTLKKSAVLSSAYFNWKHNFLDNLSLNAGLRLNYFSLSRETLPEPRLGLTYQAWSYLKFTLAYGLHSNIHSLLAYYSKHYIDTDNYEYKNLHIKATKSHHFVAGIQMQLAQKLQLKTEVYYQYLFDVPVYHSGDHTYSIINSGYSDPGGTQVFYRELFDDGKGKNYGLDITLEQNLKKGFYFLMTGSIYKSLYKPYDGKWYNTAWSSDYMFSLLSGKEFVFSKTKALHVDVNLNYTGGRPYTPIDKPASIAAGEAVYDSLHNFSYKLPYYFRTDFRISYKMSGKHITQEWQLDLRNMFNRKNYFSQRYNNKKKELEYTYQNGFLPVMQYRIFF